MNSTTMAPKAGAVPELLVDIASISSRLFWLVRNSMSGAAAGLQLTSWPYATPSTTPRLCWTTLKACAGCGTT